MSSNQTKPDVNDTIAMFEPCRCGRIREAWAAFQNEAAWDGSPTVSLFRGEGEARQYFTTSSLRIRCQACDDTGRVPTYQGSQLMEAIAKRVAAMIKPKATEAKAVSHE